MLKRAMLVWAVLPAIFVFGFDYIHGVHNIAAGDYEAIIVLSFPAWLYLCFTWIHEA